MAEVQGEDENIPKNEEETFPKIGVICSQYGIFGSAMFYVQDLLDKGQK